MDAETAVEAIEVDAAGEVAAVAAAGDSVIAAEVAAVGDELADHAEVSEERHEEILEGTQWLGLRVDGVMQRLDALFASMDTLQAQVRSNQQLTQSQLELIQMRLEMSETNPNPNPPPSTASQPSTPQPEVEAVVVVATPTPESASIDTPQLGTSPTKPRPKRRII